MVSRPFWPLQATTLVRARWLILAPHPDDETIGVGALIAELADLKTLVGVIHLTDGGGSRPVRDSADRQRLVHQRRYEASQALWRLTGSRRYLLPSLGWTDGRPAAAGSVRYRESNRRLRAICLRHRVDVIVAPMADDAHCDHRAAYQLATHCVQSVPRAVRVAEYCVWGTAPSSRTHRSIRSACMPRGRRRSALRAHQSQLYPSNAQAFSLPMAMRNPKTFDFVYLRRS